MKIIPATQALQTERATSHGLCALLCLLLSALAAACTSITPPSLANVDDCTPFGGFSGMTAIGANEYLAVHDAKGAAGEPRLTRIAVAREGYRCSAIGVADWKDGEGPSNDLESAAALPGRPDEFLVLESGKWKGRFGRLFHVRIDGDRAEVLHVFRLPSFISNSEGIDGDDYEGLATFRRGDGSFLLLLGERGGSEPYPHALLRVGVLDARAESLEWIDGGRRTIEISAPGPWPAGVRPREIADLHVDEHGTLWIAASAEGGKNGPFRSIVYRAGRVTGDPSHAVDIESPRAAWVIDGLKVEALASAPSSIKGAALAIGSEDENLGGIWRVLFDPAQ